MLRALFLGSLSLTAGFVLPAAPGTRMPLASAGIRSHSRRLTDASERSLMMAEAIDDEGNSVMASEVGVSFAEAAAAATAEGPTLPPEKQAMLVLPKSGMTDLDFDISTSAMDYATLDFEVRPMMNTFEEYFYGLTADSHESFTITSEPIEGTMARRGGEPTPVSIRCDPNGKQGEFVAHVAFILPEEKAFSTFYKITCKAT